eukprot:5509560-Prymnesium_polylepis.1
MAAPPLRSHTRSVEGVRTSRGPNYPGMTNRRLLSPLVAGNARSTKFIIALKEQSWNSDTRT